MTKPTSILTSNTIFRQCLKLQITAGLLAADPLLINQTLQISEGKTNMARQVVHYHWTMSRGLITDNQSPHCKIRPCSCSTGWRKEQVFSFTIICRAPDVPKPWRRRSINLSQAWSQTGGVKTILPPILSSASCPPFFLQPSHLRFLFLSCGEVHFCLHLMRKWMTKQAWRHFNIGSGPFQL